MHILQKNTHTCNKNINLATKKFPRVFSKIFQEFSWKRCRKEDQDAL